MRVVLLAPTPANPFTGGHIYNARVAADAASTRLVACTPETLPRELAVLTEHDIPVLDSLFFHALPATSAQLARCVWLVHLLPDADHNRTAAARTALTPLIQAQLGAAAGAIATSDHTAAAVRARAKVAVHTCRPGVEVDPAVPDATAPPRILSIANFEPRKGLVELCRCLASLADLPWHWDIVGDPRASVEVAPALRAALQATGLAARTTLHGALAPAAVHALRRHASVFALLSRSEPYGMVFAEAIAAGVPVVAYASGGVAESVTHLTTGLLADDGDEDAVRAHLRALLGDPALRAGYARRARAQRFPTWNECAAGFARSAQILARGAERPR